MPFLSLYKVTPSSTIPINSLSQARQLSKSQMGNCASPQYAKRDSLSHTLNIQSTAKVIHTDGSLHEFKQPIKANLILSQYPNFFLCSSEFMFVDCRLPRVADDEELQLGQIYFLMPLSRSNAPLSLQELCALAIKASAALAKRDGLTKTSSYLHGDVERFCKVSVGFDIVCVNFPAGRNSGKLGTR
ncbi:hypothetical protein MANES_15G147000v8 [Manihot esculenta]|uniref:Uncharacterized protein n=1 Tax=Manihot esculenta TaxID=3983 RepID=A0A2C9UH14_MANES|nr:hypothetical protein MANES_15G147000v8 [Manihot esculenta]